MVDGRRAGADARTLAIWIFVAANLGIFGTWAYFTFFSSRPVGDPASTLLFTAGMLALIFAFAFAVVCVAREVWSEVLWLAATGGGLMVLAAMSVGRTGDDLGGIGTFVGAVVASFSAWKYFADRTDARRREAEQKRSRQHERIVSEWHTFVSNERLVFAIYMLEFDDPQLQTLGTRVPFPDYRAWKNPLDQILDHLLRLACSVRDGELSEHAVADALGWYFRKVATHEHLRQYCARHGYAPLVNFSEALHAKAQDAAE